MENEEKKGCCGEKENCHHCVHSCCHNWKKCHMMRKIIWIIIIIMIFCLGSQWGEMRGGFRYNDRFERDGMMNWGGNRFNSFYSSNPQKATGEVTIKVNDTPVNPINTPKQ